LQNIHGGGIDGILSNEFDDNLLGYLFDNLEPVARNIGSSIYNPLLKLIFSAMRISHA